MIARGVSPWETAKKKYIGPERATGAPLGAAPIGTTPIAFVFDGKSVAPIGAARTCRENDVFDRIAVLGLTPEANNTGPSRAKKATPAHLSKPLAELVAHDRSHSSTSGLLRSTTPHSRISESRPIEGAALE